MEVLIAVFANIIESHLGKKAEIKKVNMLSGGCINQAYKIETEIDVFFIKLNKANGVEPFEAEAKALSLLKKNSAIMIPEVVAWDTVDDFSYLLLQYLTTEGRVKNYWEDFGVKLADLHQCSNEYYGLDHDNFIGALPQVNSPHKDWISFFIHNRLDIQLKIALRAGRVNSTIAGQFESLYKKLDQLLIVEPPSLLHGDLWSGNVLSDDNGMVALIDPAVYFGNREAEIAFTTLFGGFDQRFYDSYQEVKPFEKGYEQRFDLYNLYPLMVHLNLFGGGYLNSVLSVLSRYS